MDFPEAVETGSSLSIGRASEHEVGANTEESIMRTKTMWKFVGAVACLGVGLFASRMLWAQEGRFGPQNTPLSVPIQDAILGRNDDAKHTAWISGVMRRLHAIKPGHTRADLLKVCTTEGGLSNARQRQYVYKGCPYIKVEVHFRPAGDAEKTNVLDEQPTDIITKISQPFLQWSIMD
jgi:hypothetical protein